MRQLGRSCVLAATVLGVALSGLVAGATPASAEDKPKFQMPFPCRERWEGGTRPTHSPSALSVDWNRDAYDLGKPVIASAGGQVTSVVDLGDRSYGLYIVIDHGGGWTSLYAHLSKAFVATGQRVDQGQLIALLGSSGGSSGPHLHFEERLDRTVQRAVFNGRTFTYDTWLTSRSCVDVPVIGDWNGDRRSDVGTFGRTAGAAGFKQLIPGGTREVTSFGGPTDEPVLGDWNADGQTDFGVRDARSGTFALAKANGGRTRFQFGDSDDVPVSGDWDGDGRWEVGVYDHRTSVFFLRNSYGNMSSWYVAGTGLPITGDWDGDGRWDLGHYDLPTRTFSLAQKDGSTTSIRFGSSTSLPVVGFWNGDTLSDIGAWDTTTGVFSMRLGPKRTESVRFGKIR
ncbi:MAG: M23 family metallopeptidase [Nocardioidaceae bacterium]